MNAEKISVLNIYYPRFKSSRHISYERMEDQGLTSHDIEAELFRDSLVEYKKAVNALTVDDCMFEEDFLDVNLEDEARG